MHRSTAPVVKKQPLNVYTVMLIVAFLCMMIAAILFYMELSKFDDWWNTDAVRIGSNAIRETTDFARQAFASLLR